VTPKPVKQVQRAMHPLDNEIYSVERSVSTSLRSRGAGIERRAERGAGDARDLAGAFHQSLAPCQRSED
jgi:hypothetical protein